MFSEKGMIALLEGCPKLKHISLIDAGSSIGKEAFEYIAEKEKLSLRRLYIVGHDSLMEDADLCHALGDRLFTFEAIPMSSHSQYINRKRIIHQVHYNW